MPDKTVFLDNGCQTLAQNGRKSRGKKRASTHVCWSMLFNVKTATFVEGPNSMAAFETLHFWVSNVVSKTARPSPAHRTGVQRASVHPPTNCHMDHQVGLVARALQMHLEVLSSSGLGPPSLQQFPTCILVCWDSVCCYQM